MAMDTNATCRIWSNRIPLLLLFGIATSVENLQDRLSQKAARCLTGQQFDVIQSDEILEQTFAAAAIQGEPKLWMGPQLSNMLLQRHHENLLSSQDFVDSLQVSYTRCPIQFDTS
jgi:origin recognition complex subunit 3